MTQVLTDEDLQAIRARCEAATLGPWECGKYLGGAGYLHRKADNLRGITQLGCIANFFINPTANVAFCAAARTDIPALLTEVERVTAERDAAIARAEKAEATAAVTYGQLQKQREFTKKAEQERDEARTAADWFAKRYRGLVRFSNLVCATADDKANFDAATAWLERREVPADTPDA